MLIKNVPELFSIPKYCIELKVSAMDVQMMFIKSVYGI